MYKRIVTNDKDLLKELKKSKKGEIIIFDEAGKIRLNTINGIPYFSIEQIIINISRGACLKCNKNIDKSFNYSYRWRIPLCKECRMEELDKQTKEFLGRYKRGKKK